MTHHPHITPSQRRMTLRLGFTLLAGLALLIAPAAHAAFPGANGKIAFVRCCPGGLHQIFTMNPDGTGQTQVSDGTANDQNPAWSPDGAKIAFTSGAAGAAQIWTMSTNGTGRTNVSNNAFNDYDPGWSPDATKLAFTRGAGQVYTMNANGTSQTNISNSGSNDQDPAWSPDGTKIAFHSDRTGHNEIYIMNPDGTSQTQLTNNVFASGDASEAPDWSPDGTKLAFHNVAGSSTVLGCHMNADGSSPTCGGAGMVSHTFVRWSPDGTKLVNDENPNGSNYTIWVLNPDFSGSATQLTTTTANDLAPDWQPVIRYAARPKGASPMRISLVPAYTVCASPNTAHNSSYPSTNKSACNPAQPESSYLTVGTPPANGQGANSVGSVLVNVLLGPPEDGSIAVNVTDVRCVGTTGGCSNGPLSLYSGSLRFHTAVRITDNNSTGLGSATVSDAPLDFNVPCAPTGSPTIGSTCAITTTLNTLFPGAVSAGKRAIWRLFGEARLYDGGSLGVGGSADATLFEASGLFFP